MLVDPSLLLETLWLGRIQQRLSQALPLFYTFLLLSAPDLLPTRPLLLRPELQAHQVPSIYLASLPRYLKMTFTISKTQFMNFLLKPGLPPVYPPLNDTTVCPDTQVPNLGVFLNISLSLNPQNSTYYQVLQHYFLNIFWMFPLLFHFLCKDTNQAIVSYLFYYNTLVVSPNPFRYFLIHSPH